MPGASCADLPARMMALVTETASQTSLPDFIAIWGDIAHILRGTKLAASCLCARPYKAAPGGPVTLASCALIAGNNHGVS